MTADQRCDEERCPKCGGWNVSPFVCKEHGDFRTSKERTLSYWLGEILAVIHGDGGHYRAEHGDAKATEDAIAKYYATRVPSAVETPASPTICAVCGEVHFCPSAEKTSRDDPNAAVRWICPGCTTVNAIEDEVCCIGSCKTPRPASTRRAE